MTFKYLISQLPKQLSPQAAPGTWECALDRLPDQGQVLVAGAGRGGMPALLDQCGYEVECLDLHPEHFVAPGLTCKKCDFNYPLPVESESFDVVLAVEVVEHLENPWGFLREAIRVLKPNGKLIFTSPNITSLPARVTFAMSGILPYFREESFIGVYHITPIFQWSVDRWARTTSATIESITYSRANWPTRHDVPRHWERRWSRFFKKLLPINSLTGEIACYSVIKVGVPTVSVGAHQS